jgi:hypothetical protein
VQQLSAEDRGEDRCGAADDEQERIEAGQVIAVVPVADDRAGDDDARRAGEALSQPEREQDPDIRRGDAQRRRGRVDRHADQQWPPPAAGIAERPGQQLARRQPDQAGGQAQLRGRRGGMQVTGHDRQRGQVHVDGQGRERAQRAE